MNGWVVLLWAFVSALVLIVAGVFVALLLMGRISFAPDAQPSTPPTPEATGVVDMSYSVLVLNATPEEGLDAQMRDTLLNSGWPAELVSNGPAGSQDFAETTVYYVSADDELAALGLSDLIGGAQVEQSDVYADADNPDARQLVIVVGLDRSSTVPEPTDPPD